MKFDGSCVGNVVFPIHTLVCPEYLTAVGGWLMVGIFAVCLVGKTVGT